MALYDVNDVLITQGVSKALPSPDVIEVVNRTLDGKYHDNLRRFGIHVFSTYTNIEST